MSLQTLVSARFAMTDAEIVAELNALTVEKRDTQLWTSAGLADRLGFEVIGQLDELLKNAPGMDWMRLLIAGRGIDLSLDKTQAVLEALRPLLDGPVDAIKAIGRWSVTPYQDDGGEGEVTLEQVASARTEIALNALRAATESQWITVENVIVRPAIAEGKSWAEIVALIVADLGT